MRATLAANENRSDYSRFRRFAEHSAFQHFSFTRIPFPHPPVRPPAHSTAFTPKANPFTQPTNRAKTGSAGQFITFPTLSAFYGYLELIRNKRSIVPVSIRFLLNLSTVLWLVGGVPAEASESWRSELYPENWQRPDASASFYDDKLIQDFIRTAGRHHARRLLLRRLVYWRQRRHRGDIRYHGLHRRKSHALRPVERISNRRCRAGSNDCIGRTGTLVTHLNQNHRLV